nr:hypothetical protein [Tanacetum cinerariifolium]
MKDNGNIVAKEPTGSGNTYVKVVKGDVKTGGRVKEFASLENLKVALYNEGFVNIKIKYMGNYGDFVTNGRIAWVEVEGVLLKLWSHNTFKRIADRWGKLLDVDDQEETCYHSKRLCIHTKSGWVSDFADESDDEDQEDDMSNDGGAKEHIPSGGRGMENKSEDPFQIYKLLHKNNKVDRNEGVSDDSLKYPPGFTPHGSNDADSSNVVGDNNATVKVERVNTIYEANEGSGGIRVNVISKANSAESGMSGHFKTSLLPRTRGSILGILDEVVKVGQVMGYNMKGCKSNMADIIGSQGVEEVYR